MRGRAWWALGAGALLAAGGAAWWVTAGGAEERPVLGAVRVLTADADVALPYLLDVPADPGGCPGFTVPAPKAPMFAPSVGPDGSRSDATIDLGGRVAILAVCFGPVSEVGTPQDVIDDVLSGEGLEPPFDDIVREQVTLVEVVSAHGNGPALTTRIGDVLLTDFYVEHDGFVHTVGYMRPEAVGDTYLPTVEAMLASWTWD